MGQDLSNVALWLGSISIVLIVAAIFAGAWILFNKNNGLFSQVSTLSKDSLSSCDICNYNVKDTKGDRIPGVYGFNSVYNTDQNFVGGGYYPDNAKSKPQLILEGVDGGTADSPGFTQLGVAGNATLQGQTFIGPLSTASADALGASNVALNVTVPTYLFDDLGVYSPYTTTDDAVLTASVGSATGASPSLTVTDLVVDADMSVTGNATVAQNLTVGDCGGGTTACTVLDQGSFCVGNCDDNANCLDLSQCSSYTSDTFQTSNMSIFKSLEVDGTDIIDEFDNLSSLQTGFELWSCLGVDADNQELCYPIVPSLTNFTNRVEALTSINASSSGDNNLPGTTRNETLSSADLAGWGSNSSNPKIPCLESSPGGGCIKSRSDVEGGGGIYKTEEALEY